MGFVLWIVLGALAGWIASMIMRTDAEQGWVMNVVLGVVGAIVGGLLMNLFGAPSVTGFNLYSILVATVGAVVVIWLGKMLYR